MLGPVGDEGHRAVIDHLAAGAVLPPCPLDADPPRPVAQGGAHPALAVPLGHIVGVDAGALVGVAFEASAHLGDIGFEAGHHAAGEGGLVRDAGDAVGHLRPFVLLWLPVDAPVLQ